MAICPVCSCISQDVFFYFKISSKSEKWKVDNEKNIYIKKINSRRCPVNGNSNIDFNQNCTTYDWP